MVPIAIKPRFSSRVRPRKRYAATIVAGFKCTDGVVICADTQETSEGGPKKSVPKLRFEQGPLPNMEKECLEKYDLAAAFCGAGDNGPFVDKIIDIAWDAIRGAPDLYDACNAAESAIKNAYKEFGEIYQQGQCPHAQIVYSVTMEGRSRLFSAYGPVVSEQQGYVSFGIGYYLADFLASRMYDSFLTTRQCVILAAYILFQTKEHVEGCGGDSHIAVLRERESSGLVEYKLIEKITEYLKFADREVGELLLRSADFAKSPQDLETDIGRIVQTLKFSRSFHAKELKEHRDLWSRWGMLGEPVPTDDLGLPIEAFPTPSDNEEGDTQ